MQNRLPKPPKIDEASINTLLIRSFQDSAFLKEIKRITTDNRPEMNGIKLSFKIPKSWKEMPSQTCSYYFYSETLNVELQVSVSPSSNDNNITEDVIKRLKNIYPDLTNERRLQVAGKNAYEMIFVLKKQKGDAKLYINSLSVIFFHKTHLIIFNFSNTKINVEENIENINDLRILYRNLINTIKVLN